MKRTEGKPRSLLKRLWVTSAKLVIVCSAAAIGIALGVSSGAYLVYSRDLPETPALDRYQPGRSSIFYADDGTVIGTFYRERRIPFQLNELPAHTVHAFLAAEDSRFYYHFGVDIIGVVRAAYFDVKAWGFVQGGSTITQQLVRRMALTRDRTIERKIREAILACRLEGRFDKDRLLETYLNDVYLGQQCYGVKAAALSFFGKRAEDLTIGESAMLAGMVSNPVAYNPWVRPEAAHRKRNLVLRQMLRRSYIDESEYYEAGREPTYLKDSFPRPVFRAPYFTESVRRYIVDKYGEDALYNQGLKVWTTCDFKLQQHAARSVLKGAKEWEKRRGWSPGRIGRLSYAEVKDFRSGETDLDYSPGQVVTALVVKRLKRTPPQPSNDFGDAGAYLVTLAGGREAVMKVDKQLHYHRRDLVRARVTSPAGTSLQLEALTLPAVESALVCIENGAGYVRALVGGLDYDRSTFNRALQARRQPGSAFKPILFSAALEHKGYGPNTFIDDEPIQVFIPSAEPSLWSPSNSDDEFVGPISFRDALVHSRNVTAVKVMLDTGVESVMRSARRMGIQSPWGRHLSMALGACEVTLMELTSAYSVFPNLGTHVKPVLVKRVMDRYGRVLEDNRPRSTDWTVRSAPGTGPSVARASHRLSPVESPIDRNLVVPAVWRPSYSSPKSFVPQSEYEPKQSGFRSGPEGLRRVMSPESAYIMLSMLRETCTRGTASSVRRMGRNDLVGKTGTTDGYTDAWFVGCNPRFTVGVWIGRDLMEPLGPGEFGAKAALPIWRDFMEIIPENEVDEISPPPGVTFPRWTRSRREQGGRLLECRPRFANRRTVARCPLDDGQANRTAELSGEEVRTLNNEITASEEDTVFGRIFTERGAIIPSHYAVAGLQKLEERRWAAQMESFYATGATAPKATRESISGNDVEQDDWFDDFDF